MIGVIRVNEDYVIDVNRYEYTVKCSKHTVDKKGEEVFETVGHYSTPEHAIKGVIGSMNKKQLSDGIHSLEQVVKIIVSNNAKFYDLLSKVVLNNENQN